MRLVDSWIGISDGWGWTSPADVWCSSLSRLWRSPGLRWEGASPLPSLSLQLAKKSRLSSVYLVQVAGEIEGVNGRGQESRVSSGQWLQKWVEKYGSRSSKCKLRKHFDTESSGFHAKCVEQAGRFFQWLSFRKGRSMAILDLDDFKQHISIHLSDMENLSLLLSQGCPECDEPIAQVKSSEQLGALLWLAGLRTLERTTRTVEFSVVFLSLTIYADACCFFWFAKSIVYETSSPLWF